MSRILSAGTWGSPDTVAHARSLVGKYLVRKFADGRVESHLITEVEAYDGAEDLASHASKGRTLRTEVMFAPAGIWYVYLCYGIHEMLNLVTGPRDYPAAVLIRGLQSVAGPGRLTKTLGITRELNGKTASRACGLWMEDRGLIIPASAVTATPRIGVDFAGPRWSRKPWRFVLSRTFDAGSHEARNPLPAKKTTPRTFR